MTATVAVNGLTLSHQGSGGYERCSAPDVCRSPGWPVPYQIVSFNRDLVRGSREVRADGGYSCDVFGSAHARCFGDEPGRGTGVISQTVGHESTWITHSPNVFIEGRPAARLSDKMFMNNRNTIAGTGGNWEPTLKTSDEVLMALCKVFCVVNNEWRGGKDARARDHMARDREFRRVIERRHGAKAAASFDKSIVHATRAFIDSPSSKKPRVDWSKRLNELEDKVRRSFFRNASRVLGRKAMEKAAGFWTRAIPVVGWAMAAYDIYDGVKTARELWKEFKATGAMNDLRQKAAQNYQIFEGRPDVAIEVDGKVKEIYDFKFDSDRWQKGQKELYDDILDGSGSRNKAVAINEEKCKCRKAP